METISKNGWNMLDSYTEGQTIYGRDGEISVISESIINNVQTFLYGKSGIGKTSLLQAGIFPKLREEHLFPVNIRVAFYNTQNLNEVIKRLVEEEAVKENPTVNKTALKIEPIDGSDVSNCSLFDYFSKVQFLDSYGCPFIPVLLFDQFEESINNEECWQHTVDFLRGELYDLLDNSITSGAALPYTNYRIVISMREDYLYCIEDIIDRYSLNELRYNRFRVTALNDIQAENVIRLTSGEDGLERGRESIIVKTIIDYVKRNSSARFSEINTALLSLVCSLLSSSSPDGCIKYGELRNVNKLLNSFYDETCAKLKIGERTRKYLENNLLTKDGRRSSFDKDEALLSGKISQEQLDGLVDNRILRCIPVDAVSYRYEFIHDLFAKMVSKRKSEDRQNMFKPCYDKISHSISRKSFITKLFITTFLFSCIIGIDCFVCRVLFEMAIDEQLWNSILFDVVNWFFFFYCIPLFVRRIHDMGYSGWLLLLFPVSFFFMFIGSIQGHENSILYSIIRGAGIVLLIFFILFCFLKKSSQTPYLTGYSKIYESIYKNVSISNVEFFKSLFVEFICLLLVVVSTSMIKELLSSDAISFNTIFQKYKYPWMPFGINRIIRASLLFTFFSPSIKARIRKIGYPVYLSCVPILNILLLLEGFFPDSILQKAGLKSSISTRNMKIADDDVLIELNEELILPKLNNSRKKQGILAVRMVFAFFVPFVSFYFSYKKNNYFRPLFTYCGLYPVLYLCILAFDIDSLVFYIIAGLYSIVWIHSALYCDRRTNIDIINILTSSANMTNMDVCQKIGLRGEFIDRRITRLQKEGMLIKTINQEGDIVWKAQDKH